MKTQINKLPQSEIEIKIEVPVQEWQEFFDEAAGELSRDLKIEGFRPGHAPSKMVEERLGADKILEKATDLCVKNCYVRAILDNNIEAVGRPEINVTKIARDNPFEFKVKVAVMPEVKLPDYKKIAHDLSKEKKEVSVSEEEVDKSIEWLRKSRAKHITVKRAAAPGDRVEIDFEGECEGQKMPELCSKNHPAILGRGYFLPSFESNIIGMKEGEEKRFNVFFPENFGHQALAGKMVDFKTKMNLVQESQLPELDDAFAQGLGNFKDIGVLKENVKEGLLAEKQMQEKERWRTNLINEIAEKSAVEIPEVLIEGETHRMMDDLKDKIGQLGMTYEQYLERFKKTEKEIHEEFEKKAEERVKVFLILREIAKQEKIEINEQELTEEVAKALKQFKTSEQAQTNVDIEQLKEYTKDALKNEKVFQMLENC